MFKNREIFGGIIGVAIVTMGAVFLNEYRIFDSSGIILISGILFGLIFYIYSRRQMKTIEALSLFIRKAQYELLPLEPKDQKEGEFGILKSEIYKVLTRLHSQTELLQKEKQYLADTISDISHQLKTPMTSMNVMIDLLKDQELPQEKRLQFIRTLHSQMTRMEWLLSAMLTMSKLDAGTIILKKEKVFTDEMLERSLEPLLIPMELHGQTLIWEGTAGTNYTGDFSWSQEAISNILKNCIEHMKENGVLYIKTSQNPVYTEIQMKDNGCGISPEDLPHIFERFYRGKHASKASVGIGLALADKLISLQNGKIQVCSVYGESTTFTVKFYHSNM